MTHTVLAGGVGAARYLRGALEAFDPAADVPRVREVQQIRDARVLGVGGPDFDLSGVQKWLEWRDRTNERLAG